MDRREATYLLNNLRAFGKDDSDDEAIDLAIEALEREIEYGQMVVDFTKGETMKSDEWKYDTACDAETATTTEVDYCNNCPYLPWGEDCISRDGLLFALEPMMEDWEGMKTVKLIIETIPPVNQKQVTVKLNNPVDSLLTADSDECKEQKSKLDDKLQSSQETSTNVDGYRVEARSISKLDSGDIISRQAAIEAIEKEIDKIVKNPCAFTEGDFHYHNALRLAQKIINMQPSLPPSEHKTEELDIFARMYKAEREKHPYSEHKTKIGGDTE